MRIKEGFLDHGLSTTEVEEAKRKYGPNKLPEAKKETLLQEFLDQFKSFLVIILIFAAVISAFFGELIDTLAIVAIVILNAVLGVSQQRRAEAALEAVKKLANPTTKVIRNGQTQVINSEDVTVGDLVLLEAGDKVSCDGVILEERSLYLDESTLTGESVSVKKDAIEGDSEPIDKNMVFMGTAVTKGRAKVLVTAIGQDTQLGKIATKIREVKKEKTPLERQLDTLGKILGVLFLGVCVIVFIMGTLRGIPVKDMILTSISLAVAAIPEGLPAVVTIVLALGVAEMAKRNAVVRNLPAVETLGAVTHICTDKTGTLTQNKMTLVGAWFEDNYLKEGEVDKDSLKDELVRSMVLCNDATHTTGDPTEIALIDFLDEDFVKNMREKFPRVYEIPFTSETKRMTTVHQFGDKLLIVSKGAIEVILSLCTKELVNGQEKDLSMERKREILRHSEDLAAQGLRLLAFAQRMIEPPVPTNDKEIENGLTFLGFVAMKDPLRPEVKEAVDLCRGAGIRPIMITGDHPVTAYAIARELDFPEGDVVTSADLESMSDDQLAQTVDNVSVFARINPLDKLRIVEALQKKHEVVAMTGDGVNDAPALKKADIGVSMGKSGTEVAKEASDMVLMDDNFATLVDAVFEGRTIYENMRKFIVYLLSCNVGEVLVMFLALLLGYPTPLVPLQLLWLNLVTDSFPALALGMEPGEQFIMRVKPRGNKEPILTRYHYGIIAVQSIAITAATLIGFIIGLHRVGDVNEARTIAYMVLILSELIRAFSARSFEGYVFKMGLFSNRFLAYSTLAGIALMAITVYIPPLASVFGNIPPTTSEFGYIILLSLMPFAISEVAKVFRKNELGM
ncbi:calcium-translocating P-type ATPase, PMCA-type [Coprothermobacter platensis]|uniref:calcium-translocating P-type ATPase, PMCA-type n=1 Tax=Coprothermobacter platensis TaxID=108819 RepID=UPI000363E41B|nr:calcium-translocating P-type ATPase, PMCA-type [Coprothermobacter platensis]